jgi:uncharacterized membrane protein YeiH
MDQLLIYIDITGTFAFAISGALTGMNKKLDPFGVFILAFITAVGGGTLRDALISSRTAFWLIDPEYAYIVLGGTVFAILFRERMNYLKKTIMLFDSAGLGLFTIVGVEVGIQNDLNAFACLAIGTITGTFGGVLRDIFVNEVPVIFRKEIYATITILGGAIYLILRQIQINPIITQIIPIITIITLRIFAVYYHWSFPVIKFIDKENS